MHALFTSVFNIFEDVGFICIVLSAKIDAHFFNKYPVSVQLIVKSELKFVMMRKIKI